MPSFLPWSSLPSSYQQLSFERRLCELECFRIEHVTDAHRHIQRRDEAEAAPALVTPTINVRIERQAPPHFIDAAREFLARDDGADGDGARERLFAGHHRAPPSSFA